MTSNLSLAISSNQYLQPRNSVQILKKYKRAVSSSSYSNISNIHLPIKHTIAFNNNALSTYQPTK